MVLGELKPGSGVITGGDVETIYIDQDYSLIDLQNLAILTAGMNEYRGTLLVVSHDEYFLEEIGIERVIYLNR